MLSRITVLSSISIVALAACATQQENPNYKYSSKYRGGATSTVTQAGSVIQTAPVSYETVSYQAAQTPSYTQAHHECLRKEQNRELLGAGLGGTIGAIAGKELIGGTKGTVIGAGLGGAAGYGIGDKLVNCDPQPTPVQQYSAQPQQSYAVAPATAPVQQVYSAAPTVTASYEAPAIPEYQAPVTVESYVSPTDSEFNSISETGTPGYQVLQAQTVQAYEAPVVSQSIHGQAIGAQPVSYDYTANTISASADTFAMPQETRVFAGSSYGSHVVEQGDTVYSLSRKLCVGIADIQSINNLDASYGINIGDTLSLPASNC